MYFPEHPPSIDEKEAFVEYLFSQLRQIADEISTPSVRSAIAISDDLSITRTKYHKRIITMNSANGDTFTLPAASGSGAEFLIVVGVAVTSNSHIIKVANSIDEFVGVIIQTDTDSGDALKAYTALDSDGFDTITMNGTTSGGLQGDNYMIRDIAAGKYSLMGYQGATGTVVSPLSAAV